MFDSVSSTESAQPPITSSASSGRAFYQRVWRWHFFAGIFVIPFAIILALSGSIYLFKAEIEGTIEADINTRAVIGEEPMSADALFERARGSYPGAALRQFILAKENDPTIEMLIRLPDGTDRLLWVDAANGNILHSVDPADRLMTFVADIHGTLLTGENGSLVVELAASWMILLIVTGLYLGWPRGKSWSAVLVPSFRGGTRQAWKNLHISVGVWASALILALLISGLPWTGVWGDNFGEFKRAVGWAGLSADASPAATGEAREAWHIHRHEDAPAPVVGEYTLSLEALHTRARELNLTPPAMIVPPRDAGSEWQIRSNAQNRYDRVTHYYDDVTGMETRRIRFYDRHMADQIVSYGIAYHEGALFGWVNKALGVLTAIMVITLSVSGTVMWWKRRPSGALAAPQKPANHRLKPVVLGLTGFFALFLPLLGISLVTVLGLEWLWAKVRPTSA